MASREAPWTKIGVTAREITTTVGPGSIKYSVTVPPGTECRFLGTHWVVGDLTWLDINSIAYHDADHYGIKVDEGDLIDIRDIIK